MLQSHLRIGIFHLPHSGSPARNSDTADQPIGPGAAAAGFARDAMAAAAAAAAAMLDPPPPPPPDEMMLIPKTAVRPCTQRSPYSA